MAIRRILAGSILCSVLAASASGLCLAAETPAAFSSIPFKREPSVVANDMPRLIVGLGFCAALLLGAIYLVRRRNGFAGKGAAGKRLVQVMEASRLGPKTMLYVIEFEGSRHLLAEGENGIHCVASASALRHPSMEQDQ